MIFINNKQLLNKLSQVVYKPAKEKKESEDFFDALDEFDKEIEHGIESVFGKKKKKKS